MTTETDLLRLAVEDNIGWCGAVCAANGSQDVLTADIWVNLKPSPPFYPNVITCRPGAQAEVICAIERIRSLYPSFRPAVKDSFADLMLKDHGFERVLQGDWYGHTSEPQSVKIGGPWARVFSGNELRQWEAAWGEGSGKAIFSDALLSNKRITFWHQKMPKESPPASYPSGPHHRLASPTGFQLNRHRHFRQVRWRRRDRILRTFRLFYGPLTISPRTATGYASWDRCRFGFCRRQHNEKPGTHRVPGPPLHIT